MYDSVLGRFIQRDQPVNAGSNSYQYAQSDPERYVDPSGYATCCCKRLVVTKEGKAFMNHRAEVGGGMENGWKAGGSLKAGTGYGALRIEVQVELTGDPLDPSLCTIYQGIKGELVYGPNSKKPVIIKPPITGYNAKEYDDDTPDQADVKREKLTDKTGTIKWIDAPRAAGMGVNDVPASLKGKFISKCTGTDKASKQAEWEVDFRVKANGDTVEFASKFDNLPVSDPKAEKK
jgi:hypothetical protein